MPVYEYRCNDCKKKTSVWVRQFSNGAAAVCSRCGGKDMTRLFSTFAMHKTDKDVYEDILGDSQLVDGMMKNDPRALAKWSKKMGEASGDDIGPEYKDMMQRLENGESYESAASEIAKGADRAGEDNKADTE